jgi:glycosyltransferase involved in cell wall biosynthesis
MDGERDILGYAVRLVLFHRKFRRFHGGHLKVWDYFNHALATPGFDVRILFDESTSWDSSNPWTEARDRVITSLDEVQPDLLFIAGRDWQRLEGLGLLDRGIPILNLIQHIRHADEWSIQSRYLHRKAIRICVSEEVADALRSAGSEGPTIVIPNSVDLPIVEEVQGDERPTDLFIAGPKQPVMARRLYELLDSPNLRIQTMTEHVERNTFLDAIRKARVTVFLPNEEEGFYLPALEGMALGTIVVCPDCVGNRSFCIPGVSAFRPDFEFDAIAHAAQQALALSNDEEMQLRQGAQRVALDHAPASERAAFVRLLSQIDQLWAA